MKCSIKKRELPPSPPTATKTVHDPKTIGYGKFTSFHRPLPSPVDDFRRSELAVDNAHKAQKEKMARRHEIVKRMAREGASDDEIVGATGYSPGSVRRLLYKWRQEGEDIPLREKGRK